MQFTSIIAAVSFALMATAIPADNIEQRTKKETPGQKAQNQCAQGQTASCCNQIVKQTINLIPVNVGIDCTTINGKQSIRADLITIADTFALPVLSVAPITSQCSQQQSLACCSSGAQVSFSLPKFS